MTNRRSRSNGATDALLLGGILPAWLVAGVLDWYWHRLTQIERTAGVPETFFEPSQITIGATLGAAIVHHATALADVLYTKRKRTIPEAENQAHSFLKSCRI